MRRQLSLALKGCGDEGSFLRSGREQVSLLPSRRARRMQGAAGQPHFDPWEGDGTENPRNRAVLFKVCALLRYVGFCSCSFVFC